VNDRLLSREERKRDIQVDSRIKRAYVSVVYHR